MLLSCFSLHFSLSISISLKKIINFQIRQKSYSSYSSSSFKNSNEQIGTLFKNKANKSSNLFKIVKAFFFNYFVIRNSLTKLLKKIKSNFSMQNGIMKTTICSFFVLSEHEYEYK